MRTLISLTLVILFVLAVACDPETPTPVPTPEPVSTSAPSPQPTEPVAPTQVPTPTRTAIPTVTSTPTPTPTPTPYPWRFADVSVGQQFTCGLRVDGRVVCWGDTRYGGPPEGRRIRLSAREGISHALFELMAAQSVGVGSWEPAILCHLRMNRLSTSAAAGATLVDFAWTAQSCVGVQMRMANPLHPKARGLR